MRQIAPSELIINSDGSIFHLHLRPGQLATTIILVGDPGRVRQVSSHFERIEAEAANREFTTVTGTYKGKRMSVVSTGIGTDNIDIVVNEIDALFNIDFGTRTVKEEKTSLTLVRLGTCGSITPDLRIGDLILSRISVGFDGLLNYYHGRNEICELEIEQAFMELREKNPLEKIKIKDLCAMACINKSTFYAHYEDIYALANALENKLIESILASVPRTNDSVALHQAETLTRELFHAFMQNQRAVNILFSGSRQGIFANSIEKGLRQRFEEADPTFAADLNRGILLSFCVQGCFYAFANNSSRMDESKLVELLGAIAKAAQSIEF